MSVRSPLPTDFREQNAALSKFVMHFVEGGSGQPVILLHGYTDSWYSFALILPELAQHVRVIAPDQRGHAASTYSGGDYELESMACDIVELLDRLDIAKATIVGHSMGSFVARRVAVNHPQRVERLALVSGPLHAVNEQTRALVSQVRAFGGHVPAGFAEEFQASCVFDRATVPAEFFSTCVAVSDSQPVSLWQGAGQGMIADDDSGRLGNLSMPCLVLGGANDTVFSRQEQADLAAAIPQARLLHYDRCGHSPHWEQPDRFVRDLTSFLDSAR
jgi:non-heme chloroperoxidase